MPVRDRLLDLLALPALPLAAALTPWAGYRPPLTELVVPLRPWPQEPLQPGGALRVLSWNIQFCGGREEAFFYDEGPRVHVPPAEAATTLNGIAALLAELAPTVTFLQEVDRGAKRTGGVDQLRAILDVLPQQSSASACYWRAPFVPTPTRRPLGRVNMHLCTLTPYGLSGAVRRQLPLLDEPRIRQHFNLRRALLTARIPITGGGHVAVANTHLSAFSFGDGTLAQQVAELEDWMNSHPPEQPWILAGDLNLLPPDDDPERLQLSRQLYSRPEHNPLRRLIPRFKTAHDVRGAGPKTYLPHGASGATRTIDYIFYGGPLTCTEAAVLRRHNRLSDHLPLWASFRLG